MRILKSKLVKILPFLFLFTLPFLLFYPIFQGKILVAGDLSGSDMLDMHLPLKYVLHNAITSRQTPLWEKNLAMGFPILAEGQGGILYPVNILLAPLKPYMALNLSIIISFAIAAIGMYIYSRSLGFTVISAIFSSVTFSQSAFFITRIKHLNLIAVAAWVPIAFFLTKKINESDSPLPKILLGIVVAIQFLIGHPHMAFLCVFTYIVYFIFEVLRGYLKSKSPQVFVNFLSSLLVTFAIAAGLASIQLFPTFELIGKTERVDFTFENATAFPYKLKWLTSFIAPYNFGNPAVGSYKLNIYLDGIFWENCNYIGLLPIALALFSIFYFFYQRRQKIGSIFAPKSNFRQKLRNILTLFANGPFFIQNGHGRFASVHFLFFLFLALLSLTLTLGASTPIFKFIWENFPGFSFFRFPNRFNLFLVFSLSIIAGNFLEFVVNKLVLLKNYQPVLKKNRSHAEDSNREDEVRISWPFGRLFTFLLFLSFLIADLAVFANSYVGYVDAEDFLKNPQMVEKLKESKDSYRIYSTTQYGESPYQVMGWKKTEPIVSLNNSIAPNKNLLYDIASFNDRNWFEAGFSVLKRNQVEEYLLYKNIEPAAFGKILGLFNVRYIISFNEISDIEIYKEDEIDLGVEYSEKLKLFRNDQVLPRLQYVPEGKYVANEKEAFKDITSLDQLGSKTVILEDKPAKETSQFNGVLDDFKKNNPLSIDNYQNSLIEISADIKDHGFLVLSDLYYPGWKVFVDGSEKKILRANYIVRAVELEPGKHDVVFKFEPLSFRVGAVITTITFIIIIIVIIRSQLKLNDKKAEKN